jgi:DNA-directed RNA polymerase subunit beta'
MRKTTVGQLALQRIIPADLWSPGMVLDKKGMDTLLTRVAKEHPEKYRDVLHGLTQLGREVSYRTGGNSFGLQHLKTANATLMARQRLKYGLSQLRQREDLTPEARQKAMEDLLDSEGDKLTDAIYKESLAERNPLALQVLSGSRGNPSNLRSLRGFDVAYQDDKERRIPIPILHNYSEGLSPSEYWAGTYGARHGVISTKIATAKGGYFLKQLTQAAHRLRATDMDSAEGTNEFRRGLPVDVDDRDSVGSLLAVDHGEFTRNTPITAPMLAQLKAKGYDQILVRSPMVGGPADGGIYSRDAGVREKGRLAQRGEWVGIPAAQALGERLTQGALGAKHAGGVVGTGPSGFELVNALAQAPEVFPGGATHSEMDGTVGELEKAPQGGHYVSVGGVKHYVDPNLELLVKPGDKVEAGDVLTSGIPQPEAVVRHKGIGEGRRYFTQALRNAYIQSGIPVNRRNVELVSRGLLDHVRMTDLWGDYAPDDVVPYHAIEGAWTPRHGTANRPVHTAVGQYLEQPVLHYTIGTQIKPSMVPTLKKFGVHSVPVHAEKPPFEPEMQRAETSISTDPDWQTRLLGSGQKGSLLDGAHRGAVSDDHGTSYVPALAAGHAFGTLKD